MQSRKVPARHWGSEPEKKKISDFLSSPIPRFSVSPIPFSEFPVSPLLSSAQRAGELLADALSRKMNTIATSPIRSDAPLDDAAD